VPFKKRRFRIIPPTTLKSINIRANDVETLLGAAKINVVDQITMARHTQPTRRNAWATAQRWLPYRSAWTAADIHDATPSPMVALARSLRRRSRLGHDS
jgi:hypothetical protein